MLRGEMICRLGTEKLDAAPPVGPEYTRAERAFRVWMLISAWMYALAGLFFLVLGSGIAPAVNALSAKVFPALPLYPLPAEGPEGKFWLALSLSLMAMITWICRAAYLDLRRNAFLVPVLLLSKFCSSAFYLAFFIGNGQLAHFVGFMTDGPLFLFTAAMWFFAAPGPRLISRDEEDTLAAIGDALFPPGGAFELGFSDFREECLADARKMFAAQDPVSRLGCRVMIRALDLSPMYILFRPVTLRRLPRERRIVTLQKVESHWLPEVRLLLFAVKILAALPFFNRESAARAVGFIREEGCE
ncbi:MAG: hypothetical protein BWY28_00653 [bacterium ADurb.Bin236]|nr:MAG: hypothetical protein BWY28_00653 [bacterium ADurb.Bin236]